MKTSTLKNEKIASCNTLMSRRFRRLALGCALAFLWALAASGTLMAQKTQQNTSDPAYNGSTLFVPSLDVNSPTSFSSVDAARRNRPPEPAKIREDLFYPDGFLTLSSPTPDPGLSSNSGKDDVRKAEPKDKGASLRPLDPSVETTPLAVNPSLGQEDDKPKKRRDRFFFFAFSIALAGLGFFVYHEFRYREQLRSDLVRNARLCSPNATSADFDSVLAADVDLTDPRAPSYVNPHYGADVLMFDDPDNAGKKLSDPDFDGFHFEASDAQLAHRGPGLGEENFDFMPEGNPSTFSDEPVEDFVVGGGDLVTLNDQQSPPVSTQS